MNSRLGKAPRAVKRSNDAVQQIFFKRKNARYDIRETLVLVIQKDHPMSLRAAILTIALITTPSIAVAALGNGAKAPTFKTKAALAGKTFDFVLADALKKGPVVLYFYPKAFTSGCTVEAHNFAEATPEFNKAGATVIGMSNDEIATLSRFSVEECRDKFAVAVGTPAIIRAYDAAIPGTQLANRTSYVIGKDGTIRYSFSSPSPQGHVENTLKAVRALKAK
jgi:thioredoxin-dependent peroxiredoxin